LSDDLYEVDFQKIETTKKKLEGIEDALIE
jgi:hypothetical protein